MTISEKSAEMKRIFSSDLDTTHLYHMSDAYVEQA